jgi:predicted DNA-binding WGR domain protein
MAFLTHTAPTRNINRFYLVDITPTLFGEWVVLRERGRGGCPGTMRLSSYDRRNEAEIAEQRIVWRTATPVKIAKYKPRCWRGCSRLEPNADIAHR